MKVSGKVLDERTFLESHVENPGKGIIKFCVDKGT